jgi:hypothetical protein
LIDNTKVWTPANLLIYNAPLEFHAALANLVDIFWQSIVSDMAASCRNVGVVVVVDDGGAQCYCYYYYYYYFFFY